MMHLSITPFSEVLLQHQKLQGVHQLKYHKPFFNLDDSQHFDGSIKVI